MSHVPKIEKSKVQEALYLILGQDYKSAVPQDRRPHHHMRNCGKGYAAQEDDSWADDGYYYDQEEGYFESEWFEDNEPWSNMLEF